jgi:Tol biopolymer transport system component/DNA-binding winged helix-turn-helix (wHTH) protein
MVGPTARLLRFHGNELDLTQFELRRAGVRIPVARLPLELLIILVQRHRQLVTREELASLLWPDKLDAIDTQAGINNAINRLRGVLNDNADRPRFIETVLGKGYRFIAPLEIPESPTPVHSFEIVNAPSVAEPIRPAKKSRIWPWLAVAVVIALILLWKWSAKPGPAGTFSISQATFNDGVNPISASAISPGGDSIVYFDTTGLFQRSLATGFVHQLGLPPNLLVEHLAWSPDGKTALISAYDEQEKPQVWKLCPPGGGAQKLLSNGRNASFSPDGQRLLFLDDDGSDIEISSIDGTGRKSFLSASDRCIFVAAVWSPDGSRVLYIQQQSATEVPPLSDRSVESRFKRQYFARNVADGRLVASEPAFSFDSLYPMRDGRLLLLHPYRVPSATKLLGIWTARMDGRTSALVGNPELSIPTSDQLVTSLSATENGEVVSGLVENGQAEVYTADSQLVPLTNSKRLTFDLRNDFPDAWTPDSKAVIFESNRSGSFHLYRQRLGSQTAEMLTNMPGEQITASVSPDGKWLLFAQLDPGNPPSLDRLFRLSLAGGTPSEVPLSHSLDEFRCPLTGKTCVIRETVGHQLYRFSVLDPVTGQGAVLAEAPWAPSIFGDWTITSDGSAVALPSHEKDVPEILVLPLGSSGYGRTVKLKAEGQLWGIHAGLEGQSWYGEIRLGGKHNLSLIDQDGNVSILHGSDYNTWAYPSPDGSQLAFVDYSINRNVWIWRRELRRISRIDGGGGGS